MMKLVGASGWNADGDRVGTGIPRERKKQKKMRRIFLRRFRIPNFLPGIFMRPLPLIPPLMTAMLQGTIARVPIPRKAFRRTAFADRWR